jgi:integration host factor subunit beta
MNKSDLTEALSTELNLPLETTKSIISTILDSMTDALVNGGNIELRGFGSFTVRHYDSYTGRNPKTKKEVLVKSKKLPFFKVGKELKEAVDVGRKHK